MMISDKLFNYLVFASGWVSGWIKLLIDELAIHGDHITDTST